MADKPATQRNTLDQLPLLTSYFMPYRPIHQGGAGAGRATGWCVYVLVEGWGELRNTRRWVEIWMVSCCSDMKPFFFFFYLWCSTVTHQHTEALSELPENREGSTLFPTSRWKIPQTSARLIKTGLYLTDKQFIIFPVRICNAMATLFSATELVKFLILDSELTENG